MVGLPSPKGLLCLRGMWNMHNLGRIYNFQMTLHRYKVKNQVLTTSNVTPPAHICVCWPVGAVTETLPGSWAWTSILYPGGKNVLKPTISSGCPLNNVDTLLITPGVSILEAKQNMKINHMKFFLLLLQTFTQRFAIIALINYDTCYTGLSPAKGI